MRTHRRRELGRLAQAHGLRRGPRVDLTIDGAPVKAYGGETVAAVMMARDELELRRTAEGEPRGVFCGMGGCYDCLAVVDGVPNTRTCITWAADGMVVAHQEGFRARGSGDRRARPQGNG